MKKTVLLIVISILIFSLALSVQAEEITYDEDYFSDKLFSELDDNVLDALDEFGIRDLDYENIFSVSFSQITEYFKGDLKTTVKECIGDFTVYISIIMLTGFINSYFTEDKRKSFITLLSVSTVALIIVTNTSDVINMLLVTMKTSGSFMLSFIPIFTLIISLSGTPITAVTYNSITLAMAEGISALINNFSLDLIGAYICISISFAMNSMMNINRLINTVNRTANILIGFFAGGFTGLLSLKGIMSACVDTASAKSIRFLLSSMIPVVGSSISDAYSSLVGSINLIKSSLAFVAILIILIISTSAIFEATFFCISFSALSYLSDIFECEQLSGLFRAFCSVFRILLLLCILEIFIIIISTGIMLTFKGVI